jgi:hypothetical protein
MQHVLFACGSWPLSVCAFFLARPGAFFNIGIAWPHALLAWPAGGEGGSAKTKRSLISDADSAVMNGLGFATASSRQASLRCLTCTNTERRTARRTARQTAAEAEAPVGGVVVRVYCLDPAHSPATTEGIQQGGGGILALLRDMRAASGRAAARWAWGGGRGGAPPAISAACGGRQRPRQRTGLDLYYQTASCAERRA